MNFKKAFAATAIMFALNATFAHAQNDAATVNTKTSDNAISAALGTKAGTGKSDEADNLKKAQDELATTFNNLSVTGFKESPIKGLYEMKAGGNVIYFHPATEDQKGILIFGQMFDRDGVNLTDLSKSEGLVDSLKDLPLDSAITVGPKNAPVFYEFTDPDCPYCHAYDEWMKTYAKEHPVQRKLIFMVNPGHPLARAKIEHVICSKDKDEAVRYVYSEELPHNPDGGNAMQLANQKSLKTCKEAESVIQKHAQIIQAVGVNGTPSFLFNIDTKPNLIVGFDRQKISDSLAALEKPAVTKVDKQSPKTTK